MDGENQLDWNFFGKLKKNFIVVLIIYYLKLWIIVTSSFTYWMKEIFWKIRGKFYRCLDNLLFEALDNCNVKIYILDERIFLGN